MTEKKLVQFENVMSYILVILFVCMLSLVFTSCGTSKRVGGCGGSPLHLGN